MRDSSQGKSTDTSQEGWIEAEHENPNQLPGNMTHLSGGRIRAQGLYDIGASYESQYRRQIDENQRIQQQQAQREQRQRGI